MIDIKNAQKEFIEYAKKYDINSGRIKLKVKHILKVSEISKKIAIDLKLNQEQVELAQLIGLFHDIGRFEQVRLYDTFSDKDSGIDHAAYSLKVLYDDGLINRFIDTDKYDNIIKKAVFNHNKARIENDLKDEELLFCKIIRDADKVDIYRVMNEEPMDDIFWYREFKNLNINKILLEKFKNDHFVNYKDIKNNADLILAFYNYIFDINFDYCLRIIKEKGYLESFANRIKDTFKSDVIDKDVEDIVSICNDYIENRT